ncbi:RDD family protein [Paenibacillus sp. y28]|uniref:RDD family protein n=1 Tax=Paenibacillus sp. y28 TaxID=3129110 RepID=UPI003018CCAC
MQAGFGIRLGAALLDGIIVGVPLTIIALIITGISGEQEYFTNFLSLLYSLLLPVIWNGYTCGKRICKIRIVKLDGTPPSLVTMLMRTIVSGLVYGLTLGIAVIVSGIMVIVREDKRSLHDLIAGTQVVYAS